MFDTLTGRLEAVFAKLRSRGKLHPKQVDAALDDVRVALLEADAALQVVDDFLARVRTRALSNEVMGSLTPAQQVIRVVRDELTETLGGTHRAFVVPSASPAVIMLAGVQGSGKTTQAAKLALHLKEKGRHPLLAAADLARPAAVEQLFTLGAEAGVPVTSEGRDAPRVARAAVKQAKREGHDVLIVDTAGRLHVDEPMMQEVAQVRKELDPHHVLMVADAMTGQDAVVQARAFMDRIDLTGFILSKLDGDARGGAALSVRAVTGRPIYFAGVGERLPDLEPFHPDRMASRIIGMGDVLTLIDKAEKTMDQEQAAAAAERMLRAEFTLDDFLTQMREIKKLGPLQDLLAMLPGIPGGKAAFRDLRVDERDMARTEAIISSMTAEERGNPAIIGGSRRARIARGSGVTTQDVNALLKQFGEAKRMMKRLGGGKMRMPKIPGLPNIPGLG